VTGASTYINSLAKSPLSLEFFSRGELIVANETQSPQFAKTCGGDKNYAVGPAAIRDKDEKLKAQQEKIDALVRKLDAEKAAHENFRVASTKRISDLASTNTARLPTY
jgi:hypothetical protein